MSLLFNANNQRVTFGSAADIDNLSTWTALFWFYPVALSDEGIMMDKDGGSGRRRVEVDFSLNDEISINVRRVTTGTVYTTDNANLTTNKWWFIAATFDTGASAGEIVNIYLGDLSTIATERTYGTSDDGAGGVEDDSSNNLVIGNRNSTPRSQSADGRVGFFGYWNRVLTLNEVQQQQFHPHVTSGCLLFAYPGSNGTTNVPDYSGNGRTGTLLNGPTVADPMPLPPPWGFDEDAGNFNFAAAVGPPAGLRTLALTGVGI